MGTRQHKWRGTNSVYVDSRIGSDLTGDGSQYKPYQSLTRACYHNQPTAEVPTSIPSIVFKGVCTGQLSFGCCGTIRGTALGEAIYDGKGIYTDYGFYHNNIIVKNTVPATDNTPLGPWSGNRVPSFAGVGSPNHAAYVGSANSVYGVYGSSVLIHNSPLYWGCLHTGSGSNIIYSNITHHSTFKVTFGGNSAQQNYNTYYKLRAADQRLDTSMTTCVHSKCLFVDFDMLINNRMTFSYCVFTSDCGWYYLKNNIYYRVVVDETDSGASVTVVEDSAQETCTIGGGTVYTFIQNAISGGMSAAEAKLSAMPTVIAALRSGNYITTNITLNNCKFSTQTASQTFNNAAELDFTLKLDSDAVVMPGGNDDYSYAGAMPPSLNIPILGNSDGNTNCWESRSFSGLLKIDGDKIVIDTESQSTEGEGRTKIIPLNSLLTTEKTLTGVFSMFGEKFNSHGLSFWDEWNLLDRDNKIAVTNSMQTLTPGVANAPAYYIVEGDSNTKIKITINGVILQGNEAIKHGQVIMVGVGENVQFTYDALDGGTAAYLIPVLDSNMPDCIYVRMQTAVYAQAETGEIKATATYLNSGNTTITYNGHQVVTGESFQGVVGVDSFTGAAAGYKVDVIFDDDTENPLVPNNEWIPASFWDTFYVRVDNLVNQNKYYLGWNNDTSLKAITTTKGTDMAISSSGNYLSRVTTTGYNMYIREKYLQLRIHCKKIFNK